MWTRQFFLVLFFALTILTTQSHVIQKRGLLSKLFGGSTRSTQNVDANMSPQERSKVRELLKNPVVITMLSAAVGMAVQQALAAKNMNDVCDNKYVKMAYMASNIHPQLQQALNLLGCNGPNRKYGTGDKTTNRYGVTTTANYNNGDNDNDQDTNDNDNDDENTNENETLESAFPPEKESKLKQLLGIAKGEKGAKRNFLRNLFGMKKKDKAFKAGHKLPSSSYKLDKDDAKAMKDFENEVEQSH